MNQPRSRIRGPVYGIADVTATRPDGIALVQAWIAGGASVVQLRAKGLSHGEYLALARRVQPLCDAAGVLFVVNDRVEIAAELGAAVHLGQNDTSPGVVRARLPRVVIGHSTHDTDQFLAALNLPIDYVAVGPVYTTHSKTNADPNVGLQFVEWARRRLTAARRDLPLVAIGGITAENAAAVWRAGADMVAVIADVCDHPEPAQRVRTLLSAHTAVAAAPR